MKTQFKLTALAVATLALTACGGSSSDDDNAAQKPTDTIYGPFNTGTTSEPASVYFDLETMAVVTESADWDISFRRTDVFLNNTDSDNPVKAYFTGNNADFYDADSKAVADKFANATPETELADFEAVTAASIPADDMFVADVAEKILDGFYSYNPTTHQVSAADDKYFIVSSDDSYSKYRVSSLTQAGFAMSAVTFAIANQSASDAAFATSETQLVVDLAAECANDATVYVDFDTAMVVASTDAWDVSLACNADKTGTGFEISLATDATAIQDFTNSYDSITASHHFGYGFKANEYTDPAFKANPWYAYGVNGGHTLWSQYGVYIIKTDIADYKLQITSYYNDDGASGNYSFRAERLDD
ncbi:hypothetical protein C2869_04805 [Saccharobesus litoralis]|uniref:HmuY protein n=1 Tax=Saccharobesus litoralis TaxID=2172099 RepID=A0A2S0VNM9_9ALTE|nr:HmuY family protein [Saccharobesus litoralis]AWB65799.1 hypothetical protein C2869_04805 [Saccharobesus litoralis]